MSIPEAMSRNETIGEGIEIRLKMKLKGNINPEGE